jgi:type IV pilus assembly protein PilY1
MVYFGTGQFMRKRDKDAPIEPDTYQIQTVYGLWDSYSLVPSTAEGEPPTWQVLTDKILANPDVDDSSDVNSLKNSISGRSELQEQVIERELQPVSDPDGATWPVIGHTDFYLGPILSGKNQKRGWYIDLILSGETLGDGERVITAPNILAGSGQLEFSTLVPIASDDPCLTGQTKSMICVVDLMTGGGPLRPMYDLNGDNIFDEDDMVEIPATDEDGNAITLDIAPSCKETPLTGAPRILLPELPELEPEDVDEAPAWTSTPISVEYTEEQLNADKMPAYTLILSDGTKMKVRAPIPGRQGWRQVR